MEENKKGLLVIVVLIVIVAVGYMVWNSPSTPVGTIPAVASKPTISPEPVISPDQLIGKVRITPALEDKIAVHKKEILDRVSSGKPLTDADKSAIGGIMLSEAHLYGFTDAERAQIFAALQR